MGVLAAALTLQVMVRLLAMDLPATVPPDAHYVDAIAWRHDSPVPYLNSVPAVVKRISTRVGVYHPLVPPSVQDGVGGCALLHTPRVRG
jgi:hypothetical protein